MAQQGDKGRTATAAAEAAAALSGLSGFLIAASGEVESADVDGSREPLMCVLAFTCGDDWALLHGSPSGVTQLACAAAPTLDLTSRVQRNMAEVVFNFPFSVVYKSTNPFGWPRLTLLVFGTDWCNRRVIRGYGSVHLPTTPGRHVRIVRLYSPVAASWKVRLLGWFFGEPAHFLDPRTVAGADGREVVRVLSGGYVKVVFNIVLKNTALFNLSLDKPKAE
jgi:B9 domain-containing protein 1